MTKRKARSQDKPDRPVVDAFVSFLRDNGHPGLKIEQRPGTIGKIGRMVGAGVATRGDRDRCRDSRLIRKDGRT